MMLLSFILPLVILLLAAGPANASIPLSFQHTNLLRIVDLTKPYVRESTALILENISNSTQNECYWGIPLHLLPRMAYLEAKEKKSGANPLSIERSPENHPFLQIYKIRIPELKHEEKISLVISSAYIDSLAPYPATVLQEGKQHLLYEGEKHVPTLYTTLTQKTKIKLPGPVESYTQGKKNIDGEPDPTKSGSLLTYGPYGKQPPALSMDKISIHYEHTAPIAYVEHLQRDIQVSHWGNNVAVEERYELTNRAAKLKNYFSRLKYTQNSYSSPPTHAITRLTVPLRNGARDAYYVDTIGNVSTSRFRPARGTADSHLEISPRYPIYGGWNYTFQIGWNVNLDKVARVRGTERILRLPFLEGPENVQYGKFEVNIVLPEGARHVSVLRDVRVFAPQPALSEEHYFHRTFLDSIGRTAVKLAFENIVDEKHGKEIIVMYEYPRIAGLRKVVVVASGFLAVFVLRLVGGWVFEGGIGAK